LKNTIKEVAKKCGANSKRAQAIKSYLNKHFRYKNTTRFGKVDTKLLDEITDVFKYSGGKCIRCLCFIGAFCEAMTSTQLGDAEIKRSYPNNQYNPPDYSPVIPVPMEPSDTPDFFPNIYSMVIMCIVLQFRHNVLNMKKSIPVVIMTNNIFL
jgi:hypothetical protein